MAADIVQLAHRALHLWRDVDGMGPDQQPWLLLADQWCQLLLVVSQRPHDPSIEEVGAFHV